MDIAHTPAAERIARVLHGLHVSANAGGSGTSVGDGVDDSWRDHLGDALAILNTLREPDGAMVAAGDLATWSRMIDTAIAQAENL